MLQDMLADVVNGSDVASALAGLLEEETPTLAELRHGSKLTQVAIPLPTHQQSDGGSTGNSIDATSGDKVLDASDDVLQKAMPSQQQQQTEGAANAGGGVDGDTVIDGVLQQPEFQAFAEFVLDSACFSLLQESAADR